MNEGAGLIDFHFSFQEDLPIGIDLYKHPTVSGSQNKLSKTHRSSYSTWKFVHALNAVTEAEDVGNYQQPGTFHCCWMILMILLVLRIYLFIVSFWMLISKR